MNSSDDSAEMLSHRHFDERLKSSLKYPKKNELFKEYEQNSNTSKSLFLSTPSVQWHNLSKISAFLYDSNNDVYGKPICQRLSEIYIVIGTLNGYLLLFDYKQNLVRELKPFDFSSKVLPKSQPIIDGLITITSIEISMDSNYLITGYSNGFINIWDLKRSNPLITIRPVTLHELQYNGKHFHISHQYGTSITKIRVIGTKHTTFISMDDSGMVILHYGHRSFLGNYVQSRIISGDYVLGNIDDINKDHSLDFELLPIGSNVVTADKLCLFAYITPGYLVIASTRPQFKTFLTIDNKDFDEDGSSGLVSWYPAIKNTHGNLELPLLAYCWGSIIYQVKVHSEEQIDESGEMSCNIHVDDAKSINIEHPINFLKYLNHDILLVITDSENMILLNSKNLKVLSSENLNLGESYGYLHYIFNTLKSNVLILEKNQLISGNLPNWADILLSLLSNGKYVEALEESKRQFTGDEYLPLISLPSDDGERQKLLGVYLVQIFKSTIKYIFNDSEIEIYGMRKIVTLLIETCLMVKAPIDVYDMIYERIMSIDSEDIFFSVLEIFIFNSQLTTFSPSILKSMVEYYSKVDNLAILEQLVCLLDIEQLDIDFTLSLCKKYHLNETSTYIWTALLHDYITPFMDSTSKIKLLENDTLNKEQQRVVKSDINYVYPFISYTLTNRQYPTNKPLIDNPSAKLNIYYLLFNGSAIPWPSDGGVVHTTNDWMLEPTFPYLFALLKYDSQTMFSCLNEAFEDELLNELEINTFANESYKLQVNRQYIIDILLSIYHDQDARLTTIDKIRMAIFIGRNYPKYIQFIRLADSTSEEMIQLLCFVGTINNDPEASDSMDFLESIDEETLQDCQLAIRTLLTVYKPIDIESIIIQIERAGYYEVLLSLYQSEGRLFDVLKLWVKLQNEKITNFELFKPICEILEDTLVASDSFDKKELLKLLRDNLELFVRNDPKAIAEIVMVYSPDLNAEVIDFKDSSLKFEYLKDFFDIKQINTKIENKEVEQTLKLEYLRGLIRKRNTIQNLIFNNNKELGVEYKEELDTKLNDLNLKIQSFIFTLSELDESIIRMLEVDNFEVLIDWYLHHDDYKSSIDKICKIIESVTKEIEEKGCNKELEDKIWKLLDKSFMPLSSTNLKLSKNEGKFTLKEKLLLQILETCVKMLNKVNVKQNDSDKDTEVFVFYTKIVRAAFTNVINLNVEQSSSSFSKIFKKFLDGSSIHVTTLGDVNLILKEIFNSYLADEKILKLVKTLVDGDIFQNLNILEDLKKKGRSPRNIECATCGKNIWGSKVGNDVYEVWRDRLLELKDIDNEQFNFRNSIFIFKCKHAFHRKCLDNMGMSEDADKKCVICENV